ncbi:hypothetical protein MRX96_038284 [Rhipicephalus microplus]
MLRADTVKSVQRTTPSQGKSRRLHPSVTEKNRPALSTSRSSLLHSRQSLVSATASTNHDQGAQDQAYTNASSAAATALGTVGTTYVDSPSKPIDTHLEADSGFTSQQEKPTKQQGQLAPPRNDLLGQTVTLVVRSRAKPTTGVSSVGTDAALAARTRDSSRFYSTAAFLLLVAAGVVGAVFRGLLLEVENQPVYVFRGVCFGQNTAGEKRFDRPAAWADIRPAVRDARLPKPGCSQKPLLEGDNVVELNNDTTEDCSHLNVWTPCTEASEPGCRRTVVVFLSSRDFQQGNNNEYDGRWFAALGQVVVVVPNFRLGVFGFLNLSVPGAPGNVALDDQRLALEWVVSHIASFGGNASDVVLMGSAAGAWS